jgi:ribonucleoside-diphosphate reductase alpha chain
MIVANPIFEEKYKDEEWFTDDLMQKIFKNGGSLKGLRGIPEEVRKVFVTAHDIKYKDRIDIQAELQKYCSTAISSTVNLPKETTVDEIAEIYKYAYEKGLKGITIYRDGTKKNQPVTFKEECKLEEEKKKVFVRPAALPAKVYKMNTGKGKMYVTVSEYVSKPLEVIMNLGKSGQTFNSLSEAIGRLISLCLQEGTEVEKIIKTLKGISEESVAWTKFEETDKRPIQVLSIPDAIAKLLERYYSGKVYEGELNMESCPNCSLNLNAIEGCFSCTCGYSKCS